MPPPARARASFWQPIVLDDEANEKGQMDEDPSVEEAQSSPQQRRKLRRLMRTSDLPAHAAVGSREGDLLLMSDEEGNGGDDEYADGNDNRGDRESNEGGGGASVTLESMGPRAASSHAARISKAVSSAGRSGEAARSTDEQMHQKGDDDGDEDDDDDDDETETIKADVVQFELDITDALRTASWPQFREQWRFRVAQSSDVPALAKLVDYVEGHALRTDLLGAAWVRGGRQRWRDRVAKVADVRALALVVRTLRRATTAAAVDLVPDPSGDGRARRGANPPARQLRPRGRVRVEYRDSVGAQSDEDDDRNGDSD